MSHSLHTVRIKLSDGDRPQVRGFWIIWLRYVTGFDYSQHCLKCLRGVSDDRFRKGMRHGEYIANQHDARALYLCGVSSEFRWQNNLHVPILPDPDSSFQVRAYTGMTVEVTGGRLIEFPPLPSGYRGLSAKYTTCRNFQFADHFFGGRNQWERDRELFELAEPRTGTLF